MRTELCHRRVQQLPALLPDAVRRRVIETATHPGDLVAGFDTELNLSFEQVQALVSYQQVMIRNGQAAVTESLENAERLFNLKLLLGRLGI